MNKYTYNPEKRTVTFHNTSGDDKTIPFYCGGRLTVDAEVILDIHFGVITPQHAFIDSLLKKWSEGRSLPTSPFN